MRHIAKLGILLLALTGCDDNGSEAQTGCSVASLEGAYIYAQDGFNVSGAMASERTPFAQAGREIFHGDGTMSGVAWANFNGAATRVTYSGTYTVEPDCAGAVTFTDSNAVVSHYDIFIEDGGEELGFVQTDANVVTAAFERRRSSSDAACSRATLEGNYIYAGDGFVVEGGGSTQRSPFATAGLEIYSGDGTITGTDTTSTNGVVARSTYTATYTVAADCSGSYTYDGQPDNPYQIFLDPSGEEFAYVATGANRVAAGYERRR